MAWYQRTYFNINFFKFIKQFKKINWMFLLFTIIMIFFLFYFNIFFLNSVKCTPVFKNTPFLQNHIVGAHKIYYYRNINWDIIYNTIYTMKYSNYNNLSFKIIEFLDLNGNKFHRWHSLAHPHVNITGFDAVHPNILVNIQLSSTNFNNCHLLSYENLSFDERIQYIANNFYFVDETDIIVNSLKHKFSKYIDMYNIEIDKQVKNILNSHDI